MRTSVYHKSKAVAALNAGTAVTATSTGTTVDLYQGGGADFRTVLFVVQSGTITDGTHAVTVEDSDDGSSWAAAASVQGTLPSFATSDGNVVRDVGYAGLKRYCRIKVTATGATTGGVFGAVAVLYDAAGARR